MHMNPPDWIPPLTERITTFLQSLQVAEQCGRFLPCRTSATPQGSQVALGFSCFALKTVYTLGQWDALAAHEQHAWLAFIQAFQVAEAGMEDWSMEHAFIDPPVVGYLAAQRIGKRQWLHERIFGAPFLRPLQKAIIAETKQAIATLAEVDAAPRHIYYGFPMAPAAVRSYLERLEWDSPWKAGGQAAALVVFLRTQAPALLQPHEAAELQHIAARCFDALADPATGGYVRGRCPDHGELMNGAMKVLTALDWLETPIHYPERLIDTALLHLPAAEGCHLVDMVYVLYRCLQQTDHRRAEVQHYCCQVLAMIHQHHHADGGFSYNIQRSQTSYYGVPISHGGDESDIHGTCLLTWALAMIFALLEWHTLPWRVIKP